MCFGIFILLCIATVFGFCLAWICGMVAKSEIEVSTGVIIVIMAMVASIFVQYGMAAAELPSLLISFSTTVVGWLVLSGLLVSNAKISWSKGMIVAAIYSCVQFAAFFLLALLSTK
ncbi:MAG: hypothetical protein QM783_09775 [Phycisphaerales bacterium]